ncbi:MAG TPA: metallophosphoesterase [Gemmatimonas sp.]|nr:metallophosphoesterase [Gemmatimonas sp.]
MRTIVHLSDLHFGALLSPTLDPLVEQVAAIAPDLVVVSGDLTQRAQPEQFEAARAYLKRLPGPQLVIPGNHDVPLYDVFRRFASPLGRYKEYITSDLAPVFIDEEIAVVGINTARSLTFKGGRIGAAQLAEAVSHFHGLRGTQARIVVTHHPFDVPEGLDGVEAVGGVERAIAGFAGCQVDAYLSGHIHLVHFASAAQYRPGYQATLLQAGTATSSRARRESNSFFVLKVDAEAITCETQSWNPDLKQFELLRSNRFARVSNGKTTVA